MVPKQVVAIVVLAVLIITTFFVARFFLVPDSFGLTGHFRANAITAIAAQEPRYAGEEACSGCHPGIDELKIRAAHGPVRCEVCHGQARDHTLDPARHRPPHRTIPPGTCLRCHEHNATRPEDFAQIDSREHRPGIACLACHDPHEPEVERI